MGTRPPSDNDLRISFEVGVVLPGRFKFYELASVLELGERNLHNVVYLTPGT